LDILAGTISRLLRDVMGNFLSGAYRVEDLLVILVVEDDQLVQTMVEESLADGGFEPLSPHRAKRP
jgi:hypothetical protein